LNLLAWQLPELLAVVVAEGETSPVQVSPSPVGDNQVAVPVVPGRC